MELEFVAADYIYWEFIRNLRNDAVIKKGFINHDHITVRGQAGYMFHHSASFKVVLESGEPVAYYRVIEDDISFCVHPDHQGKGIGSKILDRIKEEHPAARGVVKVGNVPSAKAFNNAGYRAAYTIYVNDT